MIIIIIMMISCGFISLWVLDCWRSMVRVMCWGLVIFERGCYCATALQAPGGRPVQTARGLQQHLLQLLCAPVGDRWRGSPALPAKDSGNAHQDSAAGAGTRRFLSPGEGHFQDEIMEEKQEKLAVALANAQLAEASLASWTPYLMAAACWFAHCRWRRCVRETRERIDTGAPATGWIVYCPWNNSTQEEIE